MEMSEGTPLVSVILPTYNSSANLPEAIGSILGQTYRNLELIIVDDGSTDATAEVLAAFTDPRISVIRHQENHGVARAYNTGLGASRGGFIGFIGSDDAWIPEKLEDEIACFSRLPPEYGMVYADMWELDPAGNRRYWHSPEIAGPGIIDAARADYQVFCLGNGSALVRRNFLDRAGAFDEQFRCFVDLDFLIRLSRVCLFFHIRKPLYLYRSGRGTCSNAYEVCRSRVLLLKKYPETAVDRNFLVHQYDLIHQGLGELEADNRRLRGEIAGLAARYDHLCQDLVIMEEENGRLREELVTITGQYDKVCLEHKACEEEKRRLLDNEVSIARRYKKLQNESISGNFIRLVDKKIIGSLCPAGSRREKVYRSGVEALRRRLNPLLCSGRI
jgi:glycosyltransferase involved in cell wall biosynthesis